MNNAAARKPSKLTVHVGPDMTGPEAHVALGEIADLVKALRVAGKSSVSSTQLPEGADALLSEAIQALFAAQRLMETARAAVHQAAAEAARVARR